jgi:hypothetical protein
MPRVRLDPASSLGPAENLREPLEEQVTSALQRAVDSVDKHYHGEPVAEVAEELLEGTRAGLHSDIAQSIAPDPEALRSVAEDIVGHN